MYKSKVQIAREEISADERLKAAYIEGLKTAAALASDYDHSTSLDYRLEDLILRKLNVSNRLRKKA